MHGENEKKKGKEVAKDKSFQVLGNALVIGGQMKMKT